MFKCGHIQLEASAITYKASRQLAENEADAKSRSSPQCLWAPRVYQLRTRPRAVARRSGKPAHGRSLPAALPDARGEFGTRCYPQKPAVLQATAWERGFSVASQNICVPTGVFLSLVRKS